MQFKNLLPNLIALLFFMLFTGIALADTPPAPTPPAPTPPATPATPAVPDLSSELAALRKKNEELEAKLKAGRGGEGGDDPLGEKAREEREKKEREQADTKQIEQAVQFNMGLDRFLADNAELLPKEMSEIVALAHKENYASSFAKANAIRASLLKSFFSVQTNIDVLTESQKTKIEDFLKLTLDAREAKAGQIYADIFEPTLEMIRKVKKAEDLARVRGGIGGTQTDNEYKDRLIKRARQAHLGEKGV